VHWVCSVVSESCGRSISGFASASLCVGDKLVDSCVHLCV